MGLGNGKLSYPRYYAERQDFGGMLAGDFNQDGKPDLIAGSATLLLNDGKGHFTAPVLSQTVPDLPQSFVGGDFNRDGISDVAVNTCSDLVSLVKVFTGSGKGFYNPPRPYPVAALGGLIVAGDLNNDRITDIVVIEGNNSAAWCNGDYNPSPKMSVLLGRPDGTFAPSMDSNSPGRDVGRSAYLADIDGDGNLDLVGAWGVWLGNGDGTFQFGSDFIDRFKLRTLTVGDFNHDGSPDVVVCMAEYTSVPDVTLNYVRIFLNDGRGNLQMRSDVNLPGLIFAVNAVDLDGGQILDLAIAALTSMNPVTGPALFVARGNGDGTFGPVVSYANPALTVGSKIEAADFDRDGKPDLVMLGHGDKGAGVVYFRGARWKQVPSTMFHSTAMNSSSPMSMGLTVQTFSPLPKSASRV